MATQLDVIQAQLNAVLLLQRISLQWQIKFTRTWLNTAQIPDSDREDYFSMISTVEQKLREMDAIPSGSSN